MRPHERRGPATIQGTPPDSQGVTAGETAPEAATFIVPFAIEGHVVINTANIYEARELFDRMSAYDLIADGYDDIQVYNIEPKKACA